MFQDSGALQLNSEKKTISTYLFLSFSVYRNGSLETLLQDKQLWTSSCFPIKHISAMFKLLCLVHNAQCFLWLGGKWSGYVVYPNKFRIILPSLPPQCGQIILL